MSEGGFTSRQLIRTYKQGKKHQFTLLCPFYIYSAIDRGSRVRFPAGTGNFSLHHRVQNGSGAYPTSYPVGTRGSFPGGKWPGHETDHSPPSSAEVKEMELYLHPHNRHSWRGARFKKSTGATIPFTFTYDTCHYYVLTKF
jgi:hypothetical protein